MLNLRTSAVGLALAILPSLTSCSSTPKAELQIVTHPSGADVYLSRSGERSYRGKFGPLSGGFEKEPIDEGFLLLGTAPLDYSLPLRETEQDASAFGVGIQVVRKYEEGILRVEKQGYRPVERRVHLEDGEVKVVFRLEEEPAAPTPPQP